MPESISVAELNALLPTRTALLLDVRRAEAFAESPTIIPGALRRAPERVADWAAELPRQQPLVVYCVHGHEVSQGVAAQLAELGLPVRFLAGGIAQWQAEGGVSVSPADCQDPLATSIAPIRPTSGGAHGLRRRRCPART